MIEEVIGRTALSARLANGNEQDGCGRHVCDGREIVPLDRKGTTKPPAGERFVLKGRVAGRCGAVRSISDALERPAIEECCHLEFASVRLKLCRSRSVEWTFSRGQDGVQQAKVTRTVEKKSRSR